jgi:Leucine-rich repeat (LRR) protein
VQRKPLPPGLQESIHELCVGFKFKKLPKVWLLEDISQPFVWGLLRGSAYLPANFVGASGSDQQRSVLAHELSHIARFDAGVNLLQVMAQAIYWFHPFVWWSNRKIRQEREKCCDEMAIVHLNTLPEHYTRAIVDALVAERQSAHPIPSLAIVGSVRDIEERIKTMLKPGKKFYKRPSLVGATVALLIALVTIPTAFVLTARGQVQPTAQSVDKPAQLPNKPAADSEKPPERRYAARTFNSSVAFDVFVRETSGEGSKTVGRTPSANPLEIPACWVWWVQPSAPVKDWDLLVREISQNKVPGLKLGSATDSDVSHLAGLTGLRCLDLSGTKITDAGLEHLKGLSELQELRLKSAQVTDAGLAHLAGLTRLQWLDLSGTKITDTGLVHVKGLTRLQYLFAADTQITDAGLEHLKGLTGLQLLDVTRTQITDVGLGHLKGLTGLEDLSFSGKFTDAGVEHLKGLTRLNYLFLDGKITDAGLEHLKGLTKLSGLELHHTRITDAGLAHLKGLTRLEFLRLAHTPISGAGFAHLEGLTRLQWLDLSGTKITDAGVEHLKQSLPNLTITKDQAK